MSSQQPRSLLTQPIANALEPVLASVVADVGDRATALEESLVDALDRRLFTPIRKWITAGVFVLGGILLFGVLAFAVLLVMGIRGQWRPCVTSAAVHYVA